MNLNLNSNNAYYVMKWSVHSIFTINYTHMSQITRKKNFDIKRENIKRE